MTNIEVYTLVNSRMKTVLLDFVKFIMPNNRSSFGDCFCYPSEKLFNNLGNVMSYLEVNKNEYCSLYWSNENSLEDLTNCMFYYTDDGFTIAGIILKLNIDSSSNNNLEALKKKAILWQNKLSDYFGSEIGCITNFAHPPNNSNAFRSFCIEWNKKFNIITSQHL